MKPGPSATVSFDKCEGVISLVQRIQIVVITDGDMRHAVGKRPLTQSLNGGRGIDGIIGMNVRVA